MQLSPPGPVRLAIVSGLLILAAWSASDNRARAAATDNSTNPAASRALEQAAGDTPAASVRLEQIGYHDLGGTGLVADVWLHRGVAYVGSWAAGSDRQRGCPGKGVAIVDLADPSRPELVGTAGPQPGTSAEVVRVRSVDTPAFRGDLLAVGLQSCGANGRRGIDLWDVTDPRNPRPLGFADTGAPGGGVHELDLMQRSDGRVLALATVPFSEGAGPDQRGDLRIIEVTNPREPRELADWSARRTLGLAQEDGQGSDAMVYAHGAHASADGMRAYVAYWDAGVVILDLADPAQPRFLGRTTFVPGEEGNAHSVDVSLDGRLMVEADEVLDVESAALRVDSPPALAGFVPAGGTLPGPPWPDTPSVTAELVYLGRGCPVGDWTGQVTGGENVPVADGYPESPRGKIALLERGSCPFVEKVERARSEGAVGAVVINSADTPITLSSSQGTLGAFGIPQSAGQRLKGALASGQPVAVTLAGGFHEYHDFGGIRIWDVADPGRPRELSTFRTPRSRVDPADGPAEHGRFSAHNPVLQGDLLYVAWFSDGIRVVDVRDPAAPRELASWIPDRDGLPTAVRNYLGEGPQVWGVAVDGDLVVASDINSGLYVLRLVR